MPLERGKLGAFGSDVWRNAPRRVETESYPSLRHEFWNLDNVVMSQLRAGFVENALLHRGGAVENIIALAGNGKLTGVVNMDKGY